MDINAIVFKGIPTALHHKNVSNSLLFQSVLLIAHLMEYFAVVMMDTILSRKRLVSNALPSPIGMVSPAQ